MARGHYQTTFTSYRPFGSGTVVISGGECKLVEQLDIGRKPETTGLSWSHYIDCAISHDIRDGCTRTAPNNYLSYNDGDEVRIPDENGTRYVVVFVTPMVFGIKVPYKRAYLMRHDAVWDGSGWS